MTAVLAVACGAVLLLWPALLNGYPIVFSDTGGLLSQGLEPEIGWDKPWAYGPFVLALCLRISLWLPACVQAIVVSHVLWMVQRAFGQAAPWRHGTLCAVLAAATAAPWFAALLMPDIFAPLVVLCLFLLTFGDRLSRLERGWVVILCAIAVAVHLAHLVLAAGCIGVAVLLRWRRAAWCAVPLALALALVAAANWVGNGVPGVSPYGAIFALARLQADGPAADYLHTACPSAAPHFCAWAGRLPMDSDKFLWDPDGPIWADDSGPTLLAAEAARIVSQTVRQYPGATLRAALANTWRQLGLVRVGDAVAPDYLDVTVVPRLNLYFPPAEAARLLASQQESGALAVFAARLGWLHAAVLVLAAGASLVVGVRATRGGDWQLAGFTALVLTGVVANAFATGALSGPHHRYQARIAWLLVLPPLIAGLRPRSWPPPLGSSAPASRNPPAKSR